jgi:hypothetical protein
MIKTISVLLDEFKDYKNPYDHIRLLVKEGSLIKLKRGLYETGKDANPFAIASVLYSPSYVSFQSALSFYGLIPERVVGVTSASLGARKNKNYKTPYGDFSYQDVPGAVFNLGLKWMDDPESPFLVATKEKALCDLLAKRETVVEEGFPAFLFDDLRLDKNVLMAFSKSLVRSLAKAYGRKNVDLLARYLEKEKGE